MIIGIKGIKRLFVLTVLFVFMFTLGVGYIPLSGSGALGATKAEASGTQQLGNLKIGDKIVDKSWQWEHREGIGDYSGTGVIKSVTWIVVAKDHYGTDSGVTLLAEEVIGRHTFDNSTNSGHDWQHQGNNHWGDSGMHNATRGLRPWLNSTGIHREEGFYRAFPAAFKEAIIPVYIPNKHWGEGDKYDTLDLVFIPSTTELGDTVHSFTYSIGTVYPFFSGASNDDCIARFGVGNNRHWYWTRSPSLHVASTVAHIEVGGGFSAGLASSCPARGVRPAVNLKSDTLVTANPNEDGVYVIMDDEAPAPAPSLDGRWKRGDGQGIEISGTSGVFYSFSPGWQNFADKGFVSIGSLAFKEIKQTSGNQWEYYQVTGPVTANTVLVYSGMVISTWTL